MIFGVVWRSWDCVTFTFSPFEISKVASDRRRVCQPIGACLLLLSPEIFSITGRMCLRKRIWYVYGVLP